MKMRFGFGAAAKVEQKETKRTKRNRRRARRAFMENMDSVFMSALRPRPAEKIPRVHVAGVFRFGAEHGDDEVVAAAMAAGDEALAGLRRGAGLHPVVAHLESEELIGVVPRGV